MCSLQRVLCMLSQHILAGGLPTLHIQVILSNFFKERFTAALPVLEKLQKVNTNRMVLNLVDLILGFVKAWSNL